MADKKKHTPPKKEHTQPNGATFYTVPNQKDIYVKKPKARKPFMYTDLRYMFKASRELGGGGFKLWCYLSSNQNNYNFGLSPTTVKKEMGISKSAYERAVKELIELGYLIQYKDTTHYYFVADNSLKGGMDVDEYFDWCDETNKDDYVWTKEDYSDYTDEDDYSNDWWQND